MSRRNVVVIKRAPEPEPEPDYMVRALLPWEDEGAFRGLRLSLVEEHAPSGPTELALVAQLAWLSWRRQRLLLGERAAHMAALGERQAADFATRQTIDRALITSGASGTKEELKGALVTTARADAETLADTREDDAMARRAIAILETGDPDGYEEALSALREDTASWWEDMVSDDEHTHPDGQPHDDDNYQPLARNREQLLRFLKDDVLSVFDSTRSEIARRPAIRLQAYGESLDPFRMDKILALDERLTRQFEKALGMLLRLKEMRASAQPLRGEQQRSK